MDIDVSGWILEFLLRQNSIDDKTLNDLIRVLPLPNNNPRFKKSLILRKVESDIEKGTISERTIECLEQIEELDHREGATEVSEAFKAAYSTVAIHYTAKLIEESAGDKIKKFGTAVKRILRDRICEMERCDVGLVQNDLVRWVHEVEGGVFDSDVCENVLRKFKELDVFKTVRGYVNEAKEKMGPSFLELSCETILKDDGLSEALGLDEVSELRTEPTDVHGVRKVNEASRAHEVSKLSNQSKDSAPTDDASGIGKGKGKEASRAHEVSKLSNQSKDSAPTVDGANSKGIASRAHEVFKVSNQSKESAPTDNAGANSMGNEALKGHMLPTHKHVALKRRRGAKLVDTMETSHDRYDYIPSPEVNKVQEALESSSFELHAVVKDPLPDALRLAESLKVSTSGENEAHDLVGGNHTNANEKDPNSSHDRKGKALEADGDDDINKDQNRRIKPSLFERNSTAHTTEWSDSIDSFEEGSPTRPHLPTPQKRKVSPLSVYKMEKLIRQRKKKRWSILEEDALRTGVQKYGKGNWKLILSMYRDIFEDRTEVDLKDKWRNLTR